MTTKKTKTKDVATEIKSPAFKRAWNEALARMQGLKAGEFETWDALYEAVGEILDHDPPLYLAGGYKSAVAFAAKIFPGEDIRTIRSRVKVARYFEPKHEDRFGVSRLELLVEYKTAAAGSKGLAVRKINPQRERVRIPYGSGKTSRNVPFEDCDVPLLRAAIRRAKQGRDDSNTNESAIVKRVKAALVKNGLNGIVVSVRGTKLSFTGVDAKEIAALGKSLSAVH